MYRNGPIIRRWNSMLIQEEINDLKREYNPEAIELLVKTFHPVDLWNSDDTLGVTITDPSTTITNTALWTIKRVSVNWEGGMDVYLDIEEEK